MKGLVISWFFPPVNSSEGLVTFKLLKNSEYEYDVYTQKNNLIWTYNATASKLTSPNIHTIFAKAHEYKEWIEEGLAYFRENKDKYDFIMSRSMPPESHILAYKIKQEFPNIKWIASFGDPIDNNPFVKLTEEKPPYTIKGIPLTELPISSIVSPKRVLKNSLWKYRKKRYEKSLNRSEEEKCVQENAIQKADVLIFNNSYQKKYMLEKYDEIIQKKALIIPHTFDKDFYNHSEKEHIDKITISYVGHLDAIRNAQNFLEAVDRLNNQYPDLQNKLLIEFYGKMCDKDKVYIVDKQLYDVVRVKKPISYFESLDVMEKSDWNLLIDANLGKVLPENIFFAAKLADYMGARRNILGITMLEGASADILREIGAIVCTHSSDEIYMYLKMIIDQELNIQLKNIDNYDIVNVAKKYDQKVKELVNLK